MVWVGLEVTLELRVLTDETVLTGCIFIGSLLGSGGINFCSLIFLFITSKARSAYCFVIMIFLATPASMVIMPFLWPKLPLLLLDVSRIYLRFVPRDPVGAAADGLKCEIEFICIDFYFACCPPPELFLFLC